VMEEDPLHLQAQESQQSWCVAQENKEHDIGGALRYAPAFYYATHQHFIIFYFPYYYYDNKENEN